MPRTFFILALFVFCVPAHSQQDTVLLEDLTKALLQTNDAGTLEPIFNLKEHRKAGIFISPETNTLLRICNPHKVSIWVEGRLVDVATDSCIVYDTKALAAVAKKDPFYLHLHAAGTLEGLQLEQIGFTEVRETQDLHFTARNARNHFSEFLITGVLFLLLVTAVLSNRFPNRLRYLVSRAFSTKGTSYELADVQFFNAPGLAFSAFLSLVLGFFWTSFFSRAQIEAGEGVSFVWLWMEWAKTSGLIQLLFLAKWIFAVSIARLFAINRIHDFQLFDFVNIGLNLGVVLFAVFWIDFVFDLPFLQVEIQEMYFFICLALGVIILFLLVKFVTNYSHKKLLIITYLCATEIIPAIALIGWFYK